MEETLNSLKPLLNEVNFITDDSFFWSPDRNEVHYNPTNTDEGVWSLLHEAAHAKLGHTQYKSDFELLKLEVAAWEEAKDLARHVNIEINEDHIQDCLDTYRDWLHQRSTCPSCSNVCFQNSPKEYRCHNCYTIWYVSNSRFCRPYRLRNYSNSKETDKLRAVYI